jgi:hypothetical protein
MGEHHLLDNKENVNLLIKKLNDGLMNFRNEICQLQNIPTKSVNDYCSETVVYLSKLESEISYLIELNFSQRTMMQDNLDYITQLEKKIILLQNKD